MASLLAPADREAEVEATGWASGDRVELLRLTLCCPFLVKRNLDQLEQGSQTRSAAWGRVGFSVEGIRGGEGAP